LASVIPSASQVSSAAHPTIPRRVMTDRWPCGSAATMSRLRGLRGLERVLGPRGWCDRPPPPKFAAGYITPARPAKSIQPEKAKIESVKPTVGGESCQRRHVKIFVSGRQRIRMDDGTELEFGPGDVAIIDPGHDGWVVGDEPNVLFELAEATKVQ
jgi:hypothetical protein